MAFVTRGWDTRLETILDSHHFCGAAYTPMWLSVDMPEMRWAANAPLAKYQGKPNLSFFATTRTCLREVFANKLTDFDAFLAAGGLPFQIINTPQMAQIFGLPPGSILWMDTGFEIPLTAANKNLSYETFIPVQFSQQQVFKNTRDFYDPAGPIPEQFALPEIFADGDMTRPFLVHFKKGTAKAEHGTGDAFDNFKKSVDAWLAGQ
jgi:hypothetical protein